MSAGRDRRGHGWQWPSFDPPLSRDEWLLIAALALPSLVAGLSFGRYLFGTS